MDSLSTLMYLIAHLEQWRAAWPKVGHMKGYGASYLPSYDLKGMVYDGMNMYEIIQTMLYYLFQDVNVPTKVYMCRGGGVSDSEIQEYINTFIYSAFSSQIPNIHERAKSYVSHDMDPTPTNMFRCLNHVLSTVKIPVTSVKGYLEHLIALEKQYSVDAENIGRYNADIQKVDGLLKEKEEVLKKKMEEKKRIREEKARKEAEEKERVRAEKARKKAADEQKRVEEEERAFELEVQRRVKLELYERRVRAEVERRLKELDAAQEEIVPPVVEEVAKVKVEEVKEEVKEVKEVVEVKPVSILERLKKFF